MYYTRLRSGRRLPRLTDAGLWQYYVDEIEANAPYTAEVTQALERMSVLQAKLRDVNKVHQKLPYILKNITDMDLRNLKDIKHELNTLLEEVEGMSLSEA